MLKELIERIGDIGEINIPISLLRRGPHEDWALREKIYNSSGVTTKIPFAEVLIQFLKELNLLGEKIIRKKIIYGLTELGLDFSKLPYQEIDRLSKRQGLFLIAKTLKRGELLNELYSVLKLFNPIEPQFFCLNCKDSRISYENEWLIRFLQQLKVAYYREGEIIISAEDYDILIETIEDASIISEEDLLDILEKKRQNGVLAEQFVESFERERLQMLGRNDLAKLVKRVSIQNVTLGYDIASYNDEKSGTKYDRYIEVKGTTRNKVVFYITENELKASSLFCDKYWIYCVMNVNSKKLRRIKRLQNPFSRSPNDMKLYPILWRCKVQEN
jgi:hypothetical protein